MSSGLSNWLKLISCGTMPMQALAAASSVSMSWPNTTTLPELLFTSELTMPMMVDLPAPLGPSRAKNSPSSTSRLTPRSASTPPR